MKNIIIYLMISYGFATKKRSICMTSLMTMTTQEGHHDSFPHDVFYSIAKKKMMQIVRIIFISLFNFIIIQIRNIDTCNVCK